MLPVFRRVSIHLAFYSKREDNGDTGAFGRHNRYNTGAFGRHNQYNTGAFGRYNQ